MNTRVELRLATAVAVVAWLLGVASVLPAQENEAPIVHLWQAGDEGQRLLLRARVVSSTGQPLAGAVLNWRQADGGASYQASRYNASMVADETGSFRISTVVPGQYGGEKHIHVLVSHPGYQDLLSRVLFRGDPYLSDSNDPLAIALEEVQSEEGPVMMGGVEFVLTPQ